MNSSGVFVSLDDVDSLFLTYLKETIDQSAKLIDTLVLRALVQANCTSPVWLMKVCSVDCLQYARCLKNDNIHDFLYNFGCNEPFFKFLSLAKIFKEILFVTINIFISS